MGTAIDMLINYHISTSSPFSPWARAAEKNGCDIANSGSYEVSNDRRRLPIQYPKINRRPKSRIPLGRTVDVEQYLVKFAFFAYPSVPHVGRARHT